jgi:hypothetical protein
MRRAFWWLALVAVLLVGAGPVRADSSPYIQGSVQMLELCPQSICGAAIFVGIYRGRIGLNPNAVGTVGVVVNHDPLPPVGECADITRGLWEIQTLFRTIGGTAAGSLCTQEGGLTFTVDVAMRITTGGQGRLYFSGLLDHRPFPPTLTGDIDQQPPTP